jgi:ornithine cyclodeaminase
MTYLSEAQIQPLLSMQEAIAQVERAFLARARHRAFDIPRNRTRMPGAALHILQGGSLELNLVGFKAYYVLPTGRTSLIQLINRDTGALEVIMEAHWIGQMRTGAATAVAAKHLARKDAAVVGMFGSGRQAVTQLEAVCLVRAIREVKVFSRNPEKLRAFCDTMSRRLGLDVRPAADPRDAVAGSDILITITRGGGPVFDGAWIEPGQFIAAAGVNAIDRRELDQDTVLRSDLVVVDSREVARGESGDLLAAVESGHLYWENLTDLGEVVAGQRPGRTSADQCILFESHGMALQDIYCAAHILAKARAGHIGFPFPPADGVNP